MKKEVFKTVGLLYGFVGLAVFVLNSVRYLIKDGNLKGLSWLNVIYVSMGITLILLSLLKNEFLIISLRKLQIHISIKKLNVMLQFWIIMLITTFGILQDHAGQYALPMVLIACLMGLKYRILGKKALIAVIIFYAAIFEISASLVGLHMRGLFIILFGGFFFGITILMYQDELKRHFNLAKNYHDKLLHLEQIIEKFKGETIDVSTIKFTPRELEVLKELCLNRATNKELADSMGLTVQTIKTHIRNIFDKSGVDDRYQLIDLFKNNYVE